MAMDSAQSIAFKATSGNIDVNELHLDVRKLNRIFSQQ
jgi:hypothetical protein